MKILIGAMLIIVSAIRVNAFANSHITKEEKIKHIKEKMEKKLSLSVEQKGKVFQLNMSEQTDTKKFISNVEKRLIQNVVAK